MEPRPGILRYFGPLPVASGGGENVAGPSSSSSRDSKRPANDESDRKAKRPKRELGLRKKVTTVEGWRRKDNLKWIAYESEQHDKSRVARVWCRSCRRKPDIARKYSEASGKIASIDAFIDGTRNVKKTNMDRHTESRAHQMAHGMYFHFVLLYSVYSYAAKLYVCTGAIIESALLHVLL